MPNDTGQMNLIHRAFMESPIAQMYLRDRRITECNTALTEMFGYDRKDLIGDTVFKLYPSGVDFALVGKRSKKWLQSHTTYQDERFMQAASGEIFWISAWGKTLSPSDPFAETLWAFERRGTDEKNAYGFTERERQVANFVANGRTCRQIGVDLEISHRTVEAHRAKVMHKTGAKNAADLVSKLLLISINR
jgi:PAS domain S-box-containing protein